MPLNSLEFQGDYIEYCKVHWDLALLLIFLILLLLLKTNIIETWNKNTVFGDINSKKYNSSL